MKRARDDVGQVVKLNVGGKVFHVTTETLSGMSFFAPLVEGRFPWSLNEDGELFIDRDGGLFEVILQAHRSMQRPDQPTIAAKRASLLTECGLWGADLVAAMVNGETNPFHMRPQDREIREQEELTSDECSLLNVFEAEFHRHHPAELQLPLLFHTEEQRPPKHCTNLMEFESRLGGICGTAAFDALVQIPNIVFAGGAVLSAFLGEGSFAPRPQAKQNNSTRLTVAGCLCAS